MYCVALGTVANRALIHELTVRRFPPVLVAFADWVGAIVSFDVGQVGSPECALPGDVETALLAKFLLTVCPALSATMVYFTNSLLSAFLSTLDSC